nr:hypothetical protein [Bacillus cereus]
MTEKLQLSGRFLRSGQGVYCYTKIVTIEVIDNKVERDNLVNRVEVLERVKNLLLLPELEMATTQQVADFYGVGYHTLKSIIKRHKDELEEDGYTSKSGKQIANSIRCNMHQVEITNSVGKYTIKTKDNKEYSFSNVSNALFPKRAILRVGMLLRDSEVAKEVRTQLLNIEEHTATEVKTYEIDYEMKF